MAELGFLLTRPPHTGSGMLAFHHLARAALASGHAVSAFCYLDGVYQAIRDQRLPDEGCLSPSDALAELIRHGLTITASEVCIRARGLEPVQLVEGVRIGTLARLSELAGRVDRLVCL